MTSLIPTINKEEVSYQFESQGLQERIELAPLESRIVVYAFVSGILSVVSLVLASSVLSLKVEIIYKESND